MKSMKKSLLIWYFLIQIIVYPSLWGIVYYKAHNIIYDQLDEFLEETCDGIVASIQLNEDGELTEDSLKKIKRIVEEENEYLQLNDLQTGELLARSDSLRDTLFPYPDKVARKMKNRKRYFWNDIISEEPVRAIAFRTKIPYGGDSSDTGKSILVLLAHRREDAVARIQEIIKYTGGIFALALFFTLGAAFIISGATLRPLRRTSRELDKITAQKLDFRLTEPKHKELQPLIKTINSLLERIDTAFIRERQLTANIAHELRTPIAGLISMLEVALRQPRSEEFYKETLTEAKEVLSQSHKMVEDLLMLARIESGEVAPKSEMVPLRKLVNECWRVFSHTAQEKQIRFVNRLDEELNVNTDAEKLKIIINNILSNAVRYATPGGEIIVEYETDKKNESVAISIINTGELIPESDLPHIFERFWRGDTARAETGTHSGLGLSIARALCELLSLEIEAKNLPPDKVCFRISGLRLVQPNESK